MNSKDFVRNCVEYFGPWKNQGVRITVESYIVRRNERYLDALWPLVRDGREVNFGPPDMKALIDLHEAACDEMERGDLARAVSGASKLLTDGEELLDKEQLRVELDAVNEKLKAKVAEGKRAVKG